MSSTENSAVRLIRILCETALEMNAADLAKTGAESWAAAPYDEDGAPRSVGNYDDCVSDGYDSGYGEAVTFLASTILTIIEASKNAETTAVAE